MLQICGANDMATGTDYDRQYSRYTDKAKRPENTTEADYDRQFSRYADKTKRPEKTGGTKSHRIWFLLIPAFILVLLSAALTFFCIQQKTDPVTLLSDVASGRIRFSRFFAENETENPDCQR